MYKIGSFYFDINSSELKIPDNFKKFAVEKADSFYTYDIFKADDIKVTEKSFDVRKDEISIINKGCLEKRYLYVKGSNTPYAVLEETDSSHSVIYFTDTDYCDLESDSAFISLLSIERRLHLYNEYILHSSFIIYEGFAILFTGPSGIGKSTQASLWEKYCNAEVVNGDRSVLSFENNRFMASGSPHCGSSCICLNRCVPVKAIVILSQAPENHLEKADFHSSVMNLFKEITVNYHNEQFFNDAFEFISRIFESVPVYKLNCRADEDAVISLKSELYM